MVVVSAHRDGAATVTDRARGGPGIGILRPKMGLAAGTSHVAFDPGNASALRGRAELQLRVGNAPAAVIDAQKLVTVLPDSAEDRLLLARAFAANNNREWAERTLWTAFHDIRANEHVLAALKAMKKGDPNALTELDDEFVRQRDNRLNREFL